MVTSSTFFRAVVLHLRDLPRKRRDMSWHVQGRVKPKHDSCTTRLSWPARTAYDRQGNNGGIDALNTWKEHEGTNCTQWISMIYDWLILAACFCLILLHANVQHLRAQKYGSSQKSHSYRLVSPVSRNRDNASIWADPWHEQSMYEYNIYIYYYIYIIYIVIYTPDIAPMAPKKTQKLQKPDIE